MRVYITRNIPTPGLKLLREKNIELDIWESDEPIPHDVLVEKIKNNYDGLYCMLTDTIDGKVLDAADEFLEVQKTLFDRTVSQPQSSFDIATESANSWFLFMVTIIFTNVAFNGSLVLWDSHLIPLGVVFKGLRSRKLRVHILENCIMEKILGSRLKAICTMSVGYEHLDMKEINNRSMVAANCSTVSSDCVSEYAVTLILTLARRIIEATNAVLSGQWTTWKPMWLLGFELIDKSIGILGLGRIGFGIAQRLKAFKVSNIYYTDVNEVPYANEVNAIYVNFDEILRKSDIICITCNLTDQTRGMFNKDAFAKMKKTAVLVNVSRGGVVNHDDLYKALKDKKIGMAALDVTVPEPLPKDHPLLTLDNCIITPHVASSTWEARNAMSLLTAQNMLTILGGNDPVGRIRV